MDFSSILDAIKKDPTLRRIGSDLASGPVAAAEAVGTVGSSLYSKAVGQMHGTRALLGGASTPEALRTAQEYGDALQIQPKTERGQQLTDAAVGGLQYMLHPLVKGAHAAGEAAMDSERALRHAQSPSTYGWGAPGDDDDTLTVAPAMLAAGETLLSDTLVGPGKGGRLGALKKLSKAEKAAAATAEKGERAFARYGARPMAASSDMVVRTKDGGFTYSPKKGRFLGEPGDTGFSVAAHPEATRSVPLNELNDSAIAEWLKTQGADALKASADNMVGGWKSGDRGVLGVVRRVPSEEKAVALGTKHGERAAWNIGEGKELGLEDEYRSAGFARDEGRAPVSTARGTRGYARRMTDRQESPEGFLDRVRTMPLGLAEQAAAEGVHTLKTGGRSGDGFVGADPAIRGDAQLQAVRDRRLAQTEQGGKYGGWYEDEGSKPPDASTGFGGGALYKTNPLDPAPREYAAHSPQASPGENLSRHQSVEQGIRQPEWSPERTLAVIENDRSANAELKQLEAAAAADEGRKVRKVTGGSSLPKSVKPMYADQVEKHLNLRAESGERAMAGPGTRPFGRQPVDMGPKEGNFALNLGDAEQAKVPVTTVDRHEIRTAEKVPVLATDGDLSKTAAGGPAHGFLQGEGLIINKLMREAAARDPGYLDRIGWPKYPDGSSYPVDPKGGQAARWGIQKAQTDFPALWATDQAAALQEVLKDPMNRVSTTAPMMAAETHIPEGFDWRVRAGELDGYDPLYLQQGVKQWPEASASSPTRSHPLVAQGGHSGNTMRTSGVQSQGARFLDNREATRALAQGTDGRSGWHYGEGESRVDGGGQLPLSHAGEGTGTEALLARLSKLEQNELGPEAFSPVAGFPTAESAAAWKTRELLKEGGVPGLREYVAKHGSKGLLSLPLLATLLGQDD